MVGPAAANGFRLGRLDADVESSAYRFRYTGGAIRAEQEAGFSSLLDFPHLETDYQSSELFPLFQNRIMPPDRPDFAEYVRALDLDENADPIEILSANGRASGNGRLRSVPNAGERW